MRRKRHDHVAGASQAEAFAGQFFDRVRIAAEVLDLAGEFGVFLLQLLYLGGQGLKLDAAAAAGEVPALAEDLKGAKRQYRERAGGD